MINSLAAMRNDYQSAPMNKSDLNKNPFLQFQSWMQAAVHAELYEPNAMTLATVTAQNKPQARVVLLKELNEQGFVFFSNYQSHKAAEITHQPAVSLLFFWKELARQIRIEGLCTKITEEESEAYFQSRPRESQLGAWASPQSQRIANRTVLESRLTDLIAQYGDSQPIPKPPHWGGYIVKPDFFEFWQGRPSRLHDRITYTADAENWIMERIAP